MYRNNEVEPMEFDQFWSIYPKKQGKGPASKRYAKLTEAEKQRIAETLPDRIRTDLKWQTPKFVPMPTTYLNQERWHDEYESKPLYSKSTSRPAQDYACNACRGDTRTQRHEDICVNGQPYYDLLMAGRPMVLGVSHGTN